MIKKKRIAVVFSLLVVIAVIIVYFILNSGENNSFSVSEKKWLQDNKNQVLDIAVLNNLPYFGVDGEGIFFHFIADLEKQTGLKFNMISYNIGESPLKSDLTFEIKANKTDKEISFFTDYYVVLGKTTLFDISALKGQKVGILKSDINIGSYYVDGATLVSYDKVDDIYKAYDTGAISYVVIPYLPNVEAILSKNYTIAYRLSDMASEYILSLYSKETKLNSIIRKYYNTWMDSSFESSYKDAFVSFYFNDKKIDEQSKSSLLSKKYSYGYVSNLPYETMSNDEFVGINSKYINEFSKLTGVEFIYKKYKSMTELKKALKDGEVDIAFGYLDTTGMDVNVTPPVYEGKYVILSGLSTDLEVDSIKSLDEQKVMTISGSLLQAYLTSNSKIEARKYSTINNLTSKMGKNSIIAVNYQVYDYYKARKFKNYTVAYEGNMPKNYGFVITEKASNNVFGDMFSYYVDTVNKNDYLRDGYNDVINARVELTFVNLIASYLTYVIATILILVLILVRVLTKTKVKKQIKKEDKIKFVDMLTSLKNRNYLNYNMTKWDNNETYPQAIIIIDLNNIQYINDNFGHEEGDNAIVSAANILINNQWENSDIIRTDGNEFLVYLVGYKEEEIISYIRKLNKEFKGLPHGFGAALGYSIIKDDITTIDDAINEATLDMRTNKESLQD